MAVYRLYGRRQTGAMAVQAALSEAGVPFDYIDMPRPHTPDEIAAFAVINPRLQVPVLVHPDGTVITEGPAILSHIADAHPSTGLAPAPGSPARARHDRWIAFFQANVYEAMLRELFGERYTTDPGGAESVQDAATAYIHRHFQIFEGELAKGPYLFDQRFTLFDIYLWMLCFWMNETWLVTNCPRITRLWREAQARPALARIGAAHFG
jgi:glutathione S-transferase